MVCSGLASRTPALANERIAFLVHLLGAREEIAPDAGGGGEVGQAAAEGFDGEPFIIPVFLENRDGLRDGLRGAIFHCGNRELEGLDDLFEPADEKAKAGSKTTKQ